MTPHEIACVIIEYRTSGDAARRLSHFVNMSHEDAMDIVYPSGYSGFPDPYDPIELYWRVRNAANKHGVRNAWTDTP